MSKGDNLPKSEVEWVANLAQIALTEDDKTNYAKDLSAVLGYVNELQKIDTSQVQETMQITGKQNAMDGDFVATQNLITREEYLKRAPQSDRGFIKVKGLFQK